MIVSTKGRYALRAVVDIAENSAEKHVSLKAVAKRQNISEKYLEAIAKPLVKAHVLTSVRGKGGGYLLARSADEITALDVIEASEGEIAAIPCEGSNSKMCAREDRCRTAQVWQGLEKIVSDYLCSITIADLAMPDLAGNDYVI